MTKITQELIEIENIVKIARFHKENCHTSECGASLFYLRSSAERIARLIFMLHGSIDYQRAMDLLKDFPI